MSTKGRVLVVGIVVTDGANLADSIAQSLASSSGEWTIEQQWVATGKSPLRDVSLQVVEALSSSAPRFVILNRVLGSTNLCDYDYVIITDDVDLPTFFLDRYLGWVGKYDFALVQPPLTHDSYIGHRFVEQLDGITARQTRYVEIGPLFSMRADALPILTSFDVTTPMGWGYDFTWRLAMDTAKLKMGIVDSVAVSHKLRKPVVNHIYSDANGQMKKYLACHPRLKPEEAFYIVESFA